MRKTSVYLSFVVCRFEKKAITYLEKSFSISGKKTRGSGATASTSSAAGPTAGASTAQAVPGITRMVPASTIANTARHTNATVPFLTPIQSKAPKSSLFCIKKQPPMKWIPLRGSAFLPIPGGNYTWQKCGSKRRPGTSSCLKDLCANPKAPLAPRRSGHRPSDSP